MRDFTIKRGDTGPSLLFRITPATISLVGATAVFNMRPRDGGAAQVSRSAAQVAVTVETPTLRYNWRPQDTAVAGDFDAEFEVTYLDGTIETFPNDGFIPVSIIEDLG